MLPKPEAEAGRYSNALCHYGSSCNNVCIKALEPNFWVNVKGKSWVGMTYDKIKDHAVINSVSNFFIKCFVFSLQKLNIDMLSKSWCTMASS